MIVDSIRSQDPVNRLPALRRYLFEGLKTEELKTITLPPTLIHSYPRPRRRMSMLTLKKPHKMSENEPNPPRATRLYDSAKPSESPALKSPAMVPVPEIASDVILQGHRVVVIVHQGQRYRLLVTRNEKLILQK